MVTAAGCMATLTAQTKGAETLVPLTERVNVQADSARIDQIIDGRWVAVGAKKKHAIQRDFTCLFNGKPSYRFELRREDNTLEGYGKGETKGRAELSYCYATSADFNGLPADAYRKAQITKTVYHHGKGICPQGASRDYEFSVYIPSDLDSNVSTIFAQWHGMPDRTLVQTPAGEVKKLTVDEFIELDKTTIFKKNTGYEKVAKLDKQGNPVKDKKGNPVYKAGKKNGWLVEQGGYPPLAFGFSGGWFYIKANSDRRWLTDKDDRCNANPEKTPIMKPVTSEYKASTIAYKMPFADFPKDCWVTFRIHIDWTTYGKEAETIVKPGNLYVIVCVHFRTAVVPLRHLLARRRNARILEVFFLYLPFHFRNQRLCTYQQHGSHPQRSSFRVSGPMDTNRNLLPHHLPRLPEKERLAISVITNP